MKKEIRVLVLFALFVSVVIGSVALGGVRSNAEVTVPDDYYTSSGQYLSKYYDADKVNGEFLLDYLHESDDTCKGHLIGGKIENGGIQLKDNEYIEFGSGVYSIPTNIYYTIELYVQDFKPGKGDATLFTAGKKDATSGKYSPYFEIRYNSSKDELSVWYLNMNLTEDPLKGHTCDFFDAAANLQDALISVVVDTSNQYFCAYLNGTLLKKVSYTGISYLNEQGINYAQTGGGATFTFRSLRFYYNKITSEQIRSNYSKDRERFNKEVLNENIPTWEDYKIDTHLKAYYAGQAPLITGYNDIIAAPNTIPVQGKIDADYYNTIKNAQFKNTTNHDKAFNQMWENLANQNFGAGIWDHLELTLASDKVTGFTSSYIDKDGYHIDSKTLNLMNKCEKDGAYIDYNTASGNDSQPSYDYVKSVFFQSEPGKNNSFTVQLFIGDFDATGDACLFGMKNGKDDWTEFGLYYDNSKSELYVKCPKANDISFHNPITTYPKVSITKSELKDSLITVIYDRQNTNDRHVYIYINDTLKCNYQPTGNNANLANTDWQTFYFGNAYTKCTYRCIRVYDIPLTLEQISNTYVNDDKLYHKTTTTSYKTPEKQKTSYGLVGFDKILENNNLFVGKEIKFTQDNITNDNGNGGYVNELLNDWEPATGLYITKTERLKYFIASLNNGEIEKTMPDGSIKKETTYKRTPIRIDQSATLYNFNSFDLAKDFRGRSETNSHKLTESGMETFDTTSNGGLYIQNSFYMRSKFQCGDSSVTVEDGKITDSTKLMVTADIKPVTLRDTNFCGMVIDFSDDIWNRYDPNIDYSGYEWTGHARDDSMYTHYDSETSENVFCRTSLFETGVGFNLVRTSASEEGDSTGYKMRVFVGGDGTADSTAYHDITIANIQTLLNYTIYREYVNWNYGTVGGFSNGDPVYLVKFYVNKTLVALVAMKTNGTVTKENKTYFKDAGSGAIFTVSGTTVTQVKTFTKTFSTWNANCNYGFEGHAKENDDFATPSGNILFAVNRKNNMFTFANNTNGSSDGYQMNATDEDLCRVVIDNVGYMDYHDTETQKTYKGNYVINQDMTFNLRSDLIFARKVFEPKIYFNRLAYDSTDLLYSDLTAFNSSVKSNFENGRAKNDFEWNGTKFTVADYNAAHNMAVIDNGSFLAGDQNSKITQYINSINGVFFKDIADEITYDFVDFNGETMFVKQYRAYDYFLALRQYWLDNRVDDIDAPGLSKKQGEFMYDLVKFCEACTKYDRYDEVVGHTIDRLPRCYRDDDVSKQNPILREVYDGTETTNRYDKKLEQFGKPKMYKSGSTHTYTYSFKNYNIVMKNYIGLVTQINVPEGTTIEDIKSKLHIYEAVYDSANKTWTQTDTEITSWKEPVKTSYNKETFDYIKIDDSGVITIEVPLKLSELGKEYIFILDDDGTNFQRMTYGIYNYCIAKWDTSNSRLQYLVKRLLDLAYDAEKLTSGSIIMED